MLTISCNSLGCMQQATTREEGLHELDAKLATINVDSQQEQDAATQIVERLKGQGQVQGFGGASEVPKRLYTIEELRWNRIETTELLAPSDGTLNTVQTQLQIGLLAAVLAVGAATGDIGTAGALVLFGVFLGGADAVAYGGGVRGLLVDTLGRKLNPSYGCAQTRCNNIAVRARARAR